MTVRKGMLYAKQSVGIDVDLVLFDKAAHAGHLGHPRHALQPVAQRPILERAQVRQILFVHSRPPERTDRPNRHR